MAIGNTFQFRMGAGFPGSVNRSHPASIEPGIADGSVPPTAYGLAAIYSSTSTVRQITSSDTSISGVVVRPFPTQMPTTGSGYPNNNDAFGGGAPFGDSPIDLLKYGYIIVQVNSNPTTIVKGGTVYVWTAAASGAHVQGGFEGANPSGNGITITNAYWNGPADSNNFAELVLSPSL